MLLLFACAPQKAKAPSNLLNQNDMSDIIADLHIADAIASSTKIGSVDSINQAVITYNKFVFEKHNITREKFNESFDFYKQNPALMDSVYAEVITKLSSKEMQYRGK